MPIGLRRYHKYHAQPVEVDGMRFDSKKEAKRWGELKLLEQAGQITDLKRQERFVLTVNEKPIRIRSARYKNGRAATYVADFTYREDSKLVIEDSKGMDTPVSKLKRATLEAMLNIRVRVT